MFLANVAVSKTWLARSVATVALAVSATASAFSASAPRVWFEHPLAHVTVGYDTKADREAQRRYYLVVLGPTNVDPVPPSIVGHCAAIAGPEAGKAVRAYLNEALPQDIVATATAAAGSINSVPSSASGAGTAAKAPAEGKPALKKNTKADAAAQTSSRSPSKVADANEAFSRANAALASRILSCIGSESKGLEFRLALVQRHCAFGTCEVGSGNMAGQIPATSFSLIGDWLTSRNPTASAPQANQMVVLPPGKLTDEIRPYLVGPAPDDFPVQCAAGAVVNASAKVKVDVPNQPMAAASASPPATPASSAAPQPAPEKLIRWVPKTSAGKEWYCKAAAAYQAPPANANDWPPLPDAAKAQEQFEELAARARQLKGQYIEQSVPRTIGLSREIGLRFVDVIASPSKALGELKSKPDAELRVLQDDIARDRVRECVRYRNLDKSQAVSLCAGYKLDDGLIASCLAGGLCRPKILETGRADVLMQTTVDGGRQLAIANLLPRSGAKLEQLETAVRGCAQKDGEAAAATCLLESQIGDKERKAYDCFKNSPGTTPSATDLKCALGELPAPAQAGLGCISAPNQLNCALAAGLPPPARAALKCQEEIKNDDVALAACVAKGLGGDVGAVTSAATECQSKGAVGTPAHTQCLIGKAGGDVGRALECQQKSGGKWKETAVCMAGNAVPKELGDAIACAQESSTLAAGVTCMAKNGALGANLPKPALCLAESGGNLAGAAVCSVSDGLSPEQRIFMQCLASTGGEPEAMAVCVGGQLVVKELFNCLHDKLFDNKCMGESNEIRKLASALGIELKSSTVLGQALNVPLDVLKWQVSAAQAIAGGLQDLGKNTEREFKEFAARIEQDGARVLGDAVKEGEKLVHGAAATVGAAVDGLGRVIDGAGKEVANIGEAARRESERIAKQAEIDARNALEVADKLKREAQAAAEKANEELANAGRAVGKLIPKIRLW